MKPDYEKVAALLASNRVYNSVSELHGIVSGYLCGGGEVGQSTLIWHLLGHETKPNKILGELVQRLQIAAREELESENYVFHPLLPEDDENLALRLDALGDWCEGFITGFGGAYAKGDSSLLDETREVLKDFTAIADIDERAQDETESDERDFMEVVEYVRMAACTVYNQNKTAGTANRLSIHENEDMDGKPGSGKIH